MSAINIIQIIIAIVLIGLILMQHRQSGGLGGIFGGESSATEFYQRRRGLEKMLFIFTIIGIAVFLIVSILNLVF